IVLELCGAAKLELADALMNETSAARFDAWLKDLPTAKRVLLAGHALSLAERVRHLLGITMAESLNLPKAGLACLETEDRRRAALKFFITPKLLGARAD